MFETLLLLGLACVIAAVVGGGLDAAGIIKIPPLESKPRQVLLAAVGATIITADIIFVEPDDDGPKPATNATGLPPACESELRKSGAGAGAQDSAKLLPSIKVHSGPAAITVDGRSVWVAHMDGRVTRIRLGSHERQVDPLPGVRVGTERPGQVSIAFGFQFVWDTKREDNPPRGFLAKLHPSGKLNDRIELTVPDNVAVGDGAVWVTHDDGRLTRLLPSDLSQRRVEQVGGDPHGVWAGHPPCVYVATTKPDGFIVFDSGSGKRIKDGVYRVGGAGEIAAGAGALWLTGKRTERTLLRVDPKTPDKSRSVHVGVRPYADALAAGARGVWTADGDRTVVRIDPSGRRDPEQIPLAGEPVGIAIGGDPELVWVAQRKSNEITRITPTSTR